MEHFSHKISKLKKDIIDITFDLNTFKANNHNAMTRIFNNLNKINKKSNYQSMNKTFNNNNKQKKHNNSYNFNNNTCYKKKSISLDKKSQYPFKKNNKICLSENNTNINNYNEKRSISSYLNNYMFEYNNPYDKKNYNSNNINDENEKKSNISNLNINDKAIQNFGKNNEKATEDLLNFDKENQNIISNYNEKIYNKDFNDINNQILNNKKKYKHNISHKKGLFKMYNNDIINISKKNLTNNYIKDDDINIQSENNNDTKMDYWNLFNTSTRHNTFYHPYINTTNISQKIKNDFLYKKKGVKPNSHSIFNYLLNPFKENNLIPKKKAVYKIKNLKKNVYNNRNKNLELILKYLDVTNYEEAKIKIQNLKKTQNFYNQVEQIYLGYNGENKNITNTNIILSWIYNNYKNCFENNYRIFLENIMKDHNIKDFQQMKYYVN